MLWGYKEAIEKSETKEKNSIQEGIENYKQVLQEYQEIYKNMIETMNLITRDYGSIEEYITILTMKERDMNIRQNIGINIYDFRKKIKNARDLEDVTKLYKKELNNTKINLSNYSL